MMNKKPQEQAAKKMRESSSKGSSQPASQPMPMRGQRTTTNAMNKKK